jgi:hypothetical protein
MIGEMILGIPQMVMGFQQMKQLKNVPRPNFSVSPELQKSYNRAETMAMQGLTAAERAAMETQQAGQIASQVRAGFARTGGNMAGALGVISGMGQSQFTLGLGKMDADVRRSNIRYADSIMRDINQVRMMQQRLDIERDQSRRDSAAALLNMGMQNIAQGISSAEDNVMYLAGSMMGGGIS